MKYTIIVDSFKGCLSSLNAEKAIEEGILKANSNNITTCIPFADGGEGTVDSFVSIFNGEKHTTNIIDLNQRHRTGYYGTFVLPQTNEQYAVIETATASSLAQSKAYGQNIMSYSTYGTGKQILDLVNEGYTNIIVGLGGSGTNDAGIGALTALGATLKDINGRFIDGRLGPASLERLASVDISTVNEKVKKANITLLYDSNVVLTGENGATINYSKQKGASESIMNRLETLLEKYRKLILNTYNIDFNDQQGSGAAGGLASALLLVGGKLKKGALELINLSNAKNIIENSDVVITGEGKTDYQTATGKLPLEIAKLAKFYNKPVVCICAISQPVKELYENGIDAIFSITNRPMSSKDSFENASSLLCDTAFNIANLLKKYENN